jgi:hypothetical protein
VVESGTIQAKIQLYGKSVQTVDQKITGASKLLQLRGTRPLFGEELRTRILDGARCVRFEFCFSFVFVTIRQQSPVYLTHSWQERYLRGLWFSVISLLFGLWGVPWGLLWVPWAVWVNTTGGVDCTDEVLAWLGTTHPDSPSTQRAAHHPEDSLPL